ncbi:MAG: RNA-binding transcriptional accessory protein [Elusimicrobia bacterium]|nr:RNA-binding transcriptional accessory protein [Elusimicrobiota bacterium]
MPNMYAARIARELNKPLPGVENTLALLAEDATIPFIARYRKEATGNLDEVAVAAIRDREAELKTMDERRAAILKSLTERNLLTDELKKAVEEAQTLSVLEDVYLPYRPKRRTRAMIAREKGLEPLAATLLAQGGENPYEAAKTFISEEKGVADAEQALAGARDIIAEQISEDPVLRGRMREFFLKTSEFRTKVAKGKEAEGAKFKDYFDWHEPLAKAPSHRILAMRRGEKEEVLYMRVEVEQAQALEIIERMFLKNNGPCAQQVKTAIADGYERLLSISMETEARLETKKRADTQAIGVFAHNLREILMAAPLGRKSVMALDPGFRTGCKLVCLDRQGGLLCHDVVYPTQSERMVEDAAAKVRQYCKQYGVEAIAIGNGTAGRETEEFVRSLNLNIPVVMVNESGASVYSASETARSEFPEHDVTVRGAVSIGRRLMDPLAELVKIDPKAIGVGQYQHDVDQIELKKSLDDTVMSCVNSVGVEVNTASRELLAYVSGLGTVLAKNIVEYRAQNGAFKSRAGLREVPRLGPKAFEQAAGFLRIRDAKNPLDSSAVHPERYQLVERMAADLGCAVADLLKDANLRAKIDLNKYVSDTVGLPTLKDIMTELARPGRDPREKFELFEFADISKIEDVKPGMKVPGIVTNVTAFGAFVDIGVHQDGLVHISEMADSYVRDPNTVLKVRQKVSVTVIDVDLARKRIALSLKSNPVIGPRGSGEAGQDKNAPSQPKQERSRPRPQRERDVPQTAMGAAFAQLLANKGNGR